MSIQALTWVLERSSSNGNARCVLFSIANHADRQGTNAFPSLETIAHESKSSPATVKRMLKDLRQAGELDWISGIGRQSSNFYWLPMMRIQLGLSPAPEVAQSEPLTREEVAQSEPLTREEVAQIERKSSSNRARKGLNGEPRTVLTKSNRDGGVKAEGNPDGEDAPAIDVVQLLRDTKRDLRVKKATS